jgi:replicative DNA helicase
MNGDSVFADHGHPYDPNRNEEQSRVFQTSRPPPVNFECEKALLGTLINHNGGLRKVAEVLKPEHFADPVHGRIYDAIWRLVEGGRVADAVTLRQFFENEGSFAEVGGTQYLGKLSASMVNPMGISDYGRIIRDLHLKRHLICVGEGIIARAYNPDVGDAAEGQIADAERQLSVLAETRTIGTPQAPAIQIRNAVEAISQAQRTKGLIGRSTGLTALDRVLGGFRGGRLYLIGARPSMGKSALAVAFADAIGDCFCYSGEMPADEWHERRLAIATIIPANKLSAGDVNDAEMNRIAEASLQLDQTVFIDDTPKLDMDAIARRARRHKERTGSLGLIVIDHLGKVSPADPKAMKVHQLGQITGDAKALAKELNVPVVMLAQLNRGVEGREDRRPQLSDLRDSGNIEEDADVVAFLYRKSYYLERQPPAKERNEKDLDFFTRQADHEAELAACRHVAELNIAKNRGGPTDLVRLYWDGPLMLFADLNADRQGDTR